MTSSKETLREKQSRFVICLVDLITWGLIRGYDFTFPPGSLNRTQEEADKNAQDGKGIVHSLHLLGLAVDLNIFRGGVWMNTGADYLPLGEYWESLHDDCRWGGRWGDSDHFSIEHEGVK